MEGKQIRLYPEQGRCGWKWRGKPRKKVQNGKTGRKRGAKSSKSFKIRSISYVIKKKNTDLSYKTRIRSRKCVSVIYVVLFRFEHRNQRGARKLTWHSSSL